MEEEEEGFFVVDKEMSIGNYTCYHPGGQLDLFSGRLVFIPKDTQREKKVGQASVTNIPPIKYPDPIFLLPILSHSLTHSLTCAEGRTNFENN